jgi:hypothetical protein
MHAELEAAHVQALQVEAELREELTRIYSELNTEIVRLSSTNEQQHNLIRLLQDQKQGIKYDWKAEPTKHSKKTKKKTAAPCLFCDSLKQELSISRQELKQVRREKADLERQLRLSDLSGASRRSSVALSTLALPTESLPKLISRRSLASVQTEQLMKTAVKAKKKKDKPLPLPPCSDKPSTPRAVLGEITNAAGEQTPLGTSKEGSRIVASEKACTSKPTTIPSLQCAEAELCFFDLDDPSQTVMPVYPVIEGTKLYLYASRPSDTLSVLLGRKIDLLSWIAHDFLFCCIGFFLIAVLDSILCHHVEEDAETQDPEVLFWFDIADNKGKLLIREISETDDDRLQKVQPKLGFTLQVSL